MYLVPYLTPTAHILAIYQHAVTIDIEIMRPTCVELVKTVW